MRCCISSILQKIKIPTVSSGNPSPCSSPSPSPLEEDTSSSSEEGFEEEELGEITRKVPKLHMRPKTAPAVENRKGVRYVTWNEAQANTTNARRPKSNHKYFSQVAIGFFPSSMWRNWQVFQVFSSIYLSMALWMAVFTHVLSFQKMLLLVRFYKFFLETFFHINQNVKLLTVRMLSPKFLVLSHFYISCKWEVPSQMINLVPRLLSLRQWNEHGYEVAEWFANRM